MLLLLLVVVVVLLLWWWWWWNCYSLARSPLLLPGSADFCMFFFFCTVESCHPPDVQFNAVCLAFCLLIMSALDFLMGPLM
jgi:hypothetical protein